MNNENNYDASFQIISYAGNSRGLSTEAIEAAKSNKFKEAEDKIEEAQTNFVKAHQYLTELIVDEANGNSSNEKVDLLMIHAQDHLTMATLALDNAREFLDIYKLIFNK